MGLGIATGVTSLSEVYEVGNKGTIARENDSNSSPITIPMTPVKWCAVLRFCRTNQMPAARRIAGGNPSMNSRVSTLPWLNAPFRLSCVGGAAQLKYAQIQLSLAGIGEGDGMTVGTDSVPLVYCCHR